ncbi:MAG: bifunctional dihydroorotate dehydrogenase B NAD binding subunit/NADPH-dependent glutamate synthase [Candidatus Brocadia sp. AMX2]|uniref:NADPH-dependent glutamate synthase beta chain n=1 Tax=Candidatus Brocadia sinica JPN1 TaxID=1197129 RepID=A0ABQ0K087_9BACT|nr:MULTISPECIES: bifunctional dihydroorotate dehydrogenase B NAD binding subunit/NADPH-dependent glutamate synthase [Brocadia]MBC6931722.1 bifunctional dihydroorotate dehydrogenase B NAD binding subunit/NADPH-dependent glutamate synthase [Candidatus Brocadia sp.]MBL1169335.1 bifunctional dihydroorotate dehydrogenase B NAD binding subunit/NADPH-dependent glutamate synthase [Candidatus Brocadia sp. AMX1]NOG42208.1 bifunctional dihydroorotate dehydrogenase B NAD binding subunit/NADPH-dependent glut
MFKIVEKAKIAESTFLMKIDAPKIASKRKAGQFVMLRIDEPGERIPLTIAGSDTARGTISIIFQVAGDTTRQLSGLNAGDYLLDIVGPLGHPTHIENYGTAVCIGGGLGIALVMPIAQALYDAGNHVISIISARNKDLLICEKEMQACSKEFVIATDDGSKGIKGFPTQALQDLINQGKKIDIVFAVGPVPLMAAVSKLTKPYNIKTIVSLNPIMVDGTGMCGCCRVLIDNKPKFVCVDGPEFDGHLVDYENLTQRLKTYNSKEPRIPSVSQDSSCWKPPEDRVGTTHKPAVSMHAAEGHAVIDQLAEGLSGAEAGVGKPGVKKMGAIPRQKMPEQDPKNRIKNFEEVPYGYTPEMARQEALRCLQCKKPLCCEGCPVSIDIPGFIKLIAEGDFLAAARKIKETNALPAVCGRVCPQEDQCEKVCIVGKKFKPVAIGNLERFVADYERNHGTVEIPNIPEKTGYKVAIVGAGPAGLACAGELIKMGHDVTIFEALHKAGGVLVYGIPEFRLPKTIVESEVEYLRKLGVKIELNTVIGKAQTVDELLQNDFDAVFVGTGAGLPMFLGIAGENLNGVYSANEYLTRVNLMKAYNSTYATPIAMRKNVAVIGAGNVAMDAARTALRLGAENVYVVYRRSRDEMPARIEEIHHGEEEGLQFRFLTNPIRILGDEKGWVKGLECVQMELGEPDESGRRRPIPVKGSEFVIDAECVIMSIGNGPNPLVQSTTPDLQVNKWGNIVADLETCKTSKEGVFAGGDIVTGAATVILAMGAGKKAAKAIDAYVRSKKPVAVASCSK